MRSRHFPRVCGHCDAPMARQEGTCWRCGTDWAAEDAPRVALEVLPGGAPGATPGQTDRGIDEGGGLDREIAGVLPAAAESG
jgi:hypothetical protein